MSKLRINTYMLSSYYTVTIILLTGYLCHHCLGYFINPATLAPFT